LSVGIGRKGMTDAAREAFLAGERPEDVLVYLADRAVSGIEALADHGQRVEGGVVLVLDGERGRRVTERATGTDPMDLAGAAMDVKGTIDLERFSGTCPAAADASGSASDSTDAGDSDAPDDSEGTHALRHVLAFAEERNAEVGGRYAEGDVIHAYAVCACGTAYSDYWVADER
jgi:hypothetical protein